MITSILKATRGPSAPYNHTKSWRNRSLLEDLAPALIGYAVVVAVVLLVAVALMGCSAQQREQIWYGSTLENACSGFTDPTEHHECLDTYAQQVYHQFFGAMAAVWIASDAPGTALNPIYVQVQ